MDEVNQTAEESNLRVRAQPAVNHRLTVVSHIYHQLNAGDADHCPYQYVRTLEHEEQPWKRHLKIGKEAIKVPLGWVGESNLPVALIVVENEEKDRSKAIEIVFKGSEATLFIAGGESQHFTPTNVDSICLRAVYEQTKICVTVIPG